MADFPVTASDTGLAVSESLGRFVARANLVSNAFPSFAPPSQLLDNFNRANENPLSQGGNWTNLGTSALQVVGNVCEGVAVAGNRSAMSYSGAGDFTDCDAWVTLVGSPSSNSQFLYSGVFARQAHTGFVIATGQRAYWVFSDPAVGEILLYYTNVGGGQTQLGSWSITTQPGDSLGIRCVGTTISAYYKPVGGDWQLLGSATDTHESHGYLGLLTTDPAFSMDNFGGGVPSPGRPFDSIQPNHYTVALSDFVFDAPFAVGTSVLDDFQRPNESPLSGGGRWTRTGTFGSNLNLVSHATVASTFSQFDSESYVAAGDLTDCEVWATLAQLPATGGGIFDTAGVILRQNPATASQKDCYALAYETNGTTLFLTYVDASGTGTTLGSWPLVLSNGDSIGLRAIGTTFTAYYRHGAGAWQIAGSVTDANGSHGYLGLQQLAAGTSSRITNFGGGPVGVWDSIAPLLAPHGLFPDTGLTVTDSIARAAGRFANDTALSITDAMVVFLNGNASVSLSETGLNLSDSIRKSHSTSLTDTGLTVTDSAAGNPVRRVLIVDAGLTGGDALAKHVTKLVADTGVAISEVVGRSHSASISTTGLTVSDSTKKSATHLIADAGLIVSTGLVVQKNGANPDVNLSDVGLAFSTTLTPARHFFRPVGIFAADTGLALTDGISIQVNGGPPNSCTSDFRRFLLDLEASPEYATWCTANTPGDCNTWQTYTAAILSGGAPSPPAMSTAFGDALIDAGVIALTAIIPCRAKPPPSTAPHAAFSFAVGGLTVGFTNLSTPGASGHIDSWLWTFGDGDSDASTWNPVHAYAGTGTYVVTLTVVGAGGDGISSVRHAVTVFVPAVGGTHIDAVAL